MECMNLDSGTYQLFCEVDWLSSAPSNEYVVTCYGVDSANFVNDTKKFKAEDVVKNVMRGMVDRTKSLGANYGITAEANKENKNIVTYSVKTDFNYLLTLIENSD